MIAAITSCTNTSNPSVMVAAGILAKKAVEKGLSVPPWVKTSLAPGSRVVTDYYENAGLLPYLNKLRFNVVGYGCTTCIGNSGPLPTDVTKSIDDHGLVAVSVLSGNRNFEGRISSDVRANYLMSPPLVVAYALAGRIDHDFETESLGKSQTGDNVYLKDIWPTQQEVSDVIASVMNPELYTKEYATVTDGDSNWQALKFPAGAGLRMGAGLDLHPPGAILRRHEGDARASRGHPRRPRPSRARRQRHHRPYFPGRLDQVQRPGGKIPGRTRRQARRLQLLRLAPRQP